MSNIFGNPVSTQLSNPFAASKPNPFGSTTSTGASQQSGLFGSTSSTWGTASQTQPQQSEFGSTLFPPSQTATSNLFGQPVTTQQQSNSLFPPSQTATSNIFGQPAASNQGQGSGLFGTLGQNNLPQGGGLFGTINQQQSLQQQQQQQQAGLLSKSIGQFQQSRIWSEQDGTIRQKSVTDQIELIFSKWNPLSPNSSFHTYLYNNVDPETAPFYRPDPSENEDKWEEALKKRPYPGAIPSIVRGFNQLGQRILLQEDHLRVLHGRLYEINNGLTDLLNKHDVSITARTTKCRRKHTVLSQRCLVLAAKTQVLRNRGYAMDSAEDELRQTLMDLEKKVMDPVLNSRAEEIWARMVSARERGRQLQYEMERHGMVGKGKGDQALDETTLKAASKILEDYDAQLGHLAKELEQIKKEFVEWEASKSAQNGLGVHR